MCHRFATLKRADIMKAAESIAAELARERIDLSMLDALETYRQHLFRPVDAAEAYPSSTVAVIAATGRGSQLAVADMVWGFDAPWASSGTVYNARIESILESQDSMWADAAARRRCIVAVRAFFEAHRSETVLDKTTGKSAKRQYAFERADGEPLFLAAVHEKGRFALVTTKPCSCVADVHNRMPLVLNTQEAARWLDGRYADLADRSQVPLRAKPED
ncbi:MAG: hypothetical protein PEGG_00189 [Paraeggerthella hongkongensis]|uniref:SOS response-associated peptidase family protein n=1 Tax=Paraeggerthella sp. TaxID=2897350 RepID=UPI0030E41530